MPDYDNTNKGALYKNESRRDDKDAEYSGSLNVGGVEYWISAWVSVGKEGGKMEGKKYFRLSVKPKNSRAQTTRTPPDDSGIPF